MALSPARDRKMRERYLKYREMFPDQNEDRCWVAVGESFGLEGDGARTLAALKQATAINPEWGKWQLELAKAYLRAKRYAEALKALEKCDELDSSGCDKNWYAENVLYYLGYALFGLKRFKEAAEAWRGAESAITKWGAPEPLKDFHLHRGWAHHLEGNFLDAIEAYRRGMVAPGPGDGSEDDVMNEDDVEAAQAMNENIERYHGMATQGLRLEGEPLEAVPYTN
ncbi:MAG TPA: tetratricopeptide repeat protein [Planctomycetota bacterium]|nr:tetratricopeptide repeat protein [Planctomycetota bacterium]